MMAQDHREAISIIANTTTKVFLRIRPDGSVGYHTTASMAELVPQARKSGLSMPILARHERKDEERMSSMNLLNLRPEEAFMTLHDKYYRIRIDGFPPSAWTARVRFNRLVPLDPAVSTDDLAAPAGVAP